METEPLELRYQPGLALVVIGVCAVLIVVGLLQTLGGDGTQIPVVGLAFMLAGLLGLAHNWRRHADREVVLRISRDGILDRRLSRHMIRWEQIIAIEARETAWWSRGDHGPTPFLDLFLHKSAPVTPGFVAWAWGLAGARGFVITAEGLDGTFAQIVVAAKAVADSRGVVMKV